MDIYSTYYLLAAVRAMRPEHTFFKRRYAPTNAEMDIFATAKVLADYQKNGRKSAPFVLPRIGGVSVGREGFSTYELEPGNICLTMPLTLDHLTNRGFGESLMSTLTPEDREKKYLISDLVELSARISRAEERLVIDTMIGNGCTMMHQTETPGVYQPVKVQFYDGDNNPALYTPAGQWQHSTVTNGVITRGNWYNDICNMVKMLTAAGLPATDLLMSGDVATFIIEDPWTQAMLDNRRVEMGRIDPKELTDYVIEHGVMTFAGRKLSLIESNGTFEDAAGNDQKYIPDGTVIVTAPACCRTLYGAVSQMEEDCKIHTRAGRRVTRHLSDIRTSVRETEMSARPLVAPNAPNPFSVAKNVLSD